MAEARSANTSKPVVRAWHDALPVVTPTRIAWAALAFGVALRAAQYFSNSALYVDEGALALNVINKSFRALFGPLDFNQAAPPGFLALEKIAVLAFGDSEYSLRLFPFAFSIAALFLFYGVARRALVNWAVPVAVAFFAVSEQIIYFSAQVKQYSGDVAITLLVVLAALELESRSLTAGRALQFALMGSVVVWLSHPSVFVLAGVGTTLALVALRRKEWRRLWILSGCFAAWLVSFAIFYATSLRPLSANQRLETSWFNKGTFMPLPPRTLSEAGWFIKMYFGMFSNPGDLPLPIVAGLIFALGCAALFVKRKAHLLMLIAPILFTLAASGVHKYPFGRRLLLFSVPLLLIVIAAGFEFIIGRGRPWALGCGVAVLSVLLIEIFKSPIVSGAAKLLTAGLSILAIAASISLLASKNRKLAAIVAGSGLFVCMLLQPVAGAARQAISLKSGPDVRPVLEYVRANRQPDDLIYVYHHVRASFLYYAPKYGLDNHALVLGDDERAHWVSGENEAYKRDFDELGGQPRVWLVFSLVRTIEGQNEEDYVLRYLDTRGRRLDWFRSDGSSAYLYDLRSGRIYE